MEKLMSSQASPAQYDKKFWREEVKKHLALLPEKVVLYELLKPYDSFYGTVEGYIELNTVRYRNASLGPTMRLAKALEAYCKDKNLLPKQAA